MYDDNFWLFVLAGFGAQLVDGTLSMAYGVTASSLLALLGVPPAVTSATVHAAETFTTGFSCASHHYFGNVDRRLFRRLVVPGVFGGVVGAWFLAALPGDGLRPWISAYLLVMGAVIVVKAFQTFPPARVTRHLVPLGFGGAFVDAVGGGGWGPIVASTLIARGNDVRTTVGTVAASEFVVTVAISLAFIRTTGLDFWPVILGLALGGAMAAPLGAWLCSRVPVRPLLVLVGAVIIALSLTVLLRYVP